MKNVWHLCLQSIQLQLACSQQIPGTVCAFWELPQTLRGWVTPPFAILAGTNVFSPEHNPTTHTHIYIIFIIYKLKSPS